MNRPKKQWFLSNKEKKNIRAESKRLSEGGDG